MLLGFKRRFKNPILNRTKKHTIRAYGKRRPFRVGDVCDCYIDPRRKSMELLGRWPCVRVQEIRMQTTKRRAGAPLLFIFIDGQGPLQRDEAELLARSDGFKSFDEFAAFWRGRLPFRGQIIHWNPAVKCGLPGHRKRAVRITD